MITKHRGTGQEGGGLTKRSIMSSNLGCPFILTRWVIAQNKEWRLGVHPFAPIWRSTRMQRPVTSASKLALLLAIIGLFRSSFSGGSLSRTRSPLLPRNKNIAQLTKRKYRWYSESTSSMLTPAATQRGRDHTPSRPCRK